MLRPILEQRLFLSLQHIVFELVVGVLDRVIDVQSSLVEQVMLQNTGGLGEMRTLGFRLLIEAISYLRRLSALAPTALGEATPLIARIMLSQQSRRVLSY